MTRKLMVRAIYVVYLLLLVEGGARIMFLVPAFSARLAGDHDATWRHRWLERHPTGPGGSHKFEYKFDVHDSTKGWISRPNLRDERVFEGKTLNTNSRGLRGRREYAYGKHPTKPRVLIFGDSFTFGDEVSDDETYAHYLQEMMPEAEIINMGMHGYGHDQMLVFLREEGVKYRPDVVIVGFVTIDMPRNLLAFRDYAKPRFVLTDGRLELTNSPVPSPEELLAWSWLRPRVLDVWSSVAHQIDRERGVLWDKAAAITAAILDGIVAESEKAGAIPIIVHLPTFTEFGVPDGVLTRGERIKQLKDEERWQEGRGPFGLPKVRVQKVVIKKAKKAKEEAKPEGAEGAAAAPAAAEAAKGAAPAKKEEKKK